MTSLVAILSSGKGTWAEVAKIMKGHNWEKIFIVTNDFGRNTFNKLENMEFIVINPEDTVESMIEVIKKSLSGKIMDTEVALNMSSGSGNEHMAVLSSLLKLGLGIRLVTFSDNEIKEL